MRRFDQINMIPFIDVMLVLMAIVLTTASFVEKGLIEVDLPVAEQIKNKSTQQDYIEISINIHNEVFYQGELTSLEDLDGYLGQRQNHRPVQLRVDKGAVFDAFISVISKLKHHKFENIAIETLTSRL